MYVVSGGGRRWLAKTSRFEAESWFYQEVGWQLGWVPTSTRITSRHVVLTDYLDGLPSVHEVSRDQPNEAIEMLVSLAPMLAQLHGWPSDGELHAAHPSLPELDPVPVATWIDSSEASRHVLRSLQRRDLLCRAFREASSGIGPRGLIHGDLKGDNVLWSSTEPVVLDWELCGRGFIGWDVGSVIGSMLVIWMEGMQLDGPRPDAWFDEAVVPYPEVCGAARRFLADYRRHAHHPVPSPAVVVTYTATWLTAWAWIESLFARQVDPRHLLRLVIAEGLVRNPHALLGGRPDG